MLPIDIKHFLTRNKEVSNIVISVDSMSTLIIVYLSDYFDYAFN